MLTFGQLGLGFIYPFNTVAYEKLFLRSEYGHFVGMESDSRIIRMYVPANKQLSTHLVKSIYGKKQAENIWDSVVHGDLIQWGFKVSHFDNRLYFLRVGEQFILLVVDDMAFAINRRHLLEQLKTKLSATFDVKFFGSLSSSIGWNVAYTAQGMKIDLKEYARTFLRTCGLEKCNTVRSHLQIDANILLTSPQEQLLSKRDHETYRAIVGALLCLSVCTRPDLSFPTGALAGQIHAPCTRHFIYLKRILRYVAGTLEYGLY